MSNSNSNKLHSFLKNRSDCSSFEKLSQNIGSI